MDEAKQQLMVKANKLLDQLQVADLRVKQSMAFMLIGMKMVHYGVARMGAHVVDKTDTAELREALVEAAMLRMREFSKEGFNSKLLVDNMRELDKILLSDLKEEEAKQSQLRDKELKLGIPTPFDGLNRELNGGLKAGTVVMVHGESVPVFTTMAGFYRELLKLKVPITHFGTADKKNMPEVPGVKNVPGVFWKEQGSSLEKMKAVFAVTDGYVAVVDRLDWLIDPSDHRSMHKCRHEVLKYLVKVATRYKISIVVGHVAKSDDKLPKLNSVIPLPVCKRTLDGKDVMMAGDEFFTEEHDGRLRVFGSGDKSSSGLEKVDGGTEDSQQLEGSKEDRGKEAGVGDNSAGEKPGVSDG